MSGTICFIIYLIYESEGTDYLKMSSDSTSNTVHLVNLPPTTLLIVTAGFQLTCFLLRIASIVTTELITRNIVAVLVVSEPIKPIPPVLFGDVPLIGVRQHITMPVNH